MSVSFLTPSFDAPADVTRSPVEGSLAHRLAAGSTTAALTFAGQGWPWWVSLAELLERRSWLRERAESWIDILSTHFAEPAMRDLGAAPSGFDPLRWIADEAGRPTPGELSALPISLPGVLLTQLLAYREAWEDGLALGMEAGSIISASGHSGGLIAAGAVAAQPDGLADDSLVEPFLALSVLLGHVAGTCGSAVPSSVLDAALSGDLDARTPMVAVAGLRLDRLERLLDDGAVDLTGHDGSARVALRHGPTRAVLSGSPRSLTTARVRLTAALKSDPAGGRLGWEPLAVSAPCHHPMLTDVCADVVARAAAAELVLPAPDPRVSLVAPDGPRRLVEGDDLVAELVGAMLVRPGVWDRTAAGLATGSIGTAPAEWILDLGPSDGVAKLVAGAVDGTGAQVLALNRDDDRRAVVAVGATDEQVRRYADHVPEVVTLPDGSHRIENRFTRATGRSPMILPGMTPTTVDAGIVAAAANAGFLAELAGGGQVTEAIFAERLVELGELLEPGQEVVFNALHLDPYLWGLHLGRRRLVQAARRAGAPICGVTISAGIPELDDAVALLDELAELGMWCNAFKPGTPEQVRQVLAIADAAPQHTVFVHLEGGSAGGHHSWVDIEDLLIGSYRELRARDNVVVCVGGGVGTPDRAAELLTGTWSLQHVGVVMPVDAILLGTATMAVAEATATASVKAALAAASGTATSVGRSQIRGGVTSGRSGLDADIHFLDNSASRCAALLDEVSGDADAVADRRSEIIEALERTAKPYFGDVEAMTYEQLLRRFVRLVAVGQGGRYEDGVWLDESHRRRFVDLLQRAEARLDPAETGRIPSMFPTASDVDDPNRAIDQLVDRYPAAARTVLHPADPGHFLFVCRSAGKPVPFVPVIDADVRRWYQSDSLWQAQHPAYDADQVLIIPGPAAVGGIRTVDEPVADLLGRFERHVIDALGSGPHVGTQAAPATERRPVTRLRRTGPTAGLSGPVAALLEARTVVIGDRVVVNPVRNLERAGEWALTTAVDGRLVSAELSIATESGFAESIVIESGELGTGERDVAVMTLSWPSLDTYGQPAGDSSESVTLQFAHRTVAGVDVVIHDPLVRRAALAEMLESVLIQGDLPRQGLGDVVTRRVAADPARRSAHARLLGSPAHEPLPDSWSSVVWPAVFASLGAEEIVGSLLDLVHLEHRVERLRSVAPQSAAVEFVVEARVVRIAAHDAGTQVDTVADVSDTDGAFVRVSGSFLLRDTAGIAEFGDVAADRIAEVAPERPRRTLGTSRFTAPSTMNAFASISGDHNPIHRSTAVALLAGLDGPIVHGAWTSAAAQRAVVESACAGRSGRLSNWHATFLAPVLPGEELSISMVRTGMRDGSTVVEATAVVVRDDVSVPVLGATALVAPPRTAYLFPGQGIQRDGMGMDGYERSAAARRIWDRADAHTRGHLGFSILSIVRDNPTVVAVSSPDGSTEIHRHPAGVLHLTQFTQVAMAALAMAQVAELREAGCFDEDAIVAGHSVGEYNALASIGGVLPLEVIVELVFRRGQAMHHLVPRDAAGNSDYRLGVIRPHQIDMDHATVEALVVELRDRLGETLEIVNYNLRGKQYAVAGTLRSLAALEAALDDRRSPGSKDPFLYVPGIDVPFHSGVLRDGVAEFRGHLSAGLPERIDPAVLVGRYVPNLVPQIFTLDRDFVEEVRDHVGSEQLGDVLDHWDAWSADPGRLCRELLIELLAWQFASPVRWIETQDLLFAPIEDGGLGVERVVEVGLGSQPTVANLAKGTLALGGDAARIEVTNVEADRPIVFALDEDPEPVVETEDGPSEDPPETVRAAEPPAPVQPSAPATSAAVEDLPITAADALRCLLALLMKVRPDQLDGAESIDDLVDGVSSRRNQLLMDLGSEFAISGVDGARELPLDLLAAEVGGRSGRYAFPGPVLRDAREAALPGVLGPLRMKSKDVVARVTDHWNLGNGWVERVLTALAFDGRAGDSARGGQLGRLHPLPGAGDDAVDAALALVASDAGVTLADPSAARGGGSVDAAAVVDLEARIAGPDGLVADLARDVLRRVAPKQTSTDAADTTVAERLSLLDDEHGDRRAAAVRPTFDARRHVAFTSWWATARHDVVALHHAGLRSGDLSGGTDALDDEAARLSRYVCDPGVSASAGWFAARARERGDAAAAARFERILAGDGWSVPVPAVRPGLDVDGTAIEIETTVERVSSVLADLGSRRTQDASWVDGYVEHLTSSLEGSPMGDPTSLGSGEVALVTGASPGSIAFEVVRRLLADGSTVVCTTSNDTPDRLGEYRELYRQAAAPGAELHVIRANLASFGDVDALVDWLVSPVVDNSAGVARTLKEPILPTVVLPFAAGPVSGDLVESGAGAEVSMRVLLWGVERLIGRLADALEGAGTAGRRTTVVLPLSPNHGGFGGDGAYGEAKAALEAVLEKWGSEHRRWGRHIGLVAATIGWVRGTGLMDANDAVAALVERDLGVRTFSSTEMGWLIHGLCSEAVRSASVDAPLRIDLSGGLAALPSLHAAVTPLARELADRVSSGRGADDGPEPAHDADVDAGSVAALLSPVPEAAEPRSPDADDRSVRRRLEDMVVVVGAGEVGPWGGSATRFDLEIDGELDPSSVVELAWTCGLIAWDTELDGGSWVDVETDEAVAEGEVAERYRAAVDERCGIRTFDADGPLDPDGVSFVVEVFLDEDVVVTASDEADARAFAAADPDNTTVFQSSGGDWQIRRRAGSSIRVPRRAALSRTVGGQVPNGFDPARWGIPAEMVASVDRLSLWNLVATVEAFLDAGIEPEELMARVHPARVGNTQGSGMGGMSSIQTLYRDSVLGGDHSNDLLQEGLGNVIAAYVVQSYVGGYGPMVHPVAACATAAVSIEDGVDKIRAGKADVIVAGGWDDLGLEGVLGFASMSATASAEHMEAAGLRPDQYSRSNDRRRAGFVEAQGGGTLVLARGSVAADLGLPVRAVVVYATSFADGIHTSIPAPGLGALGCVMGGERSPLAAALDDHGLVADDIAVVSKHDTSTGANDPNESDLHQRIATELGRSAGNPLMVVSQKTVTGHAKGGAAAWQAIGLLQILETGRVPGNRNLECLDESHRDHTHLVYGHRSIDTGEPLRAGLLTSLGFGHVSAAVCLASGATFVAALRDQAGEHELDRYRAAAAARRRSGRRRREEGRYGGTAAYTKRTDRRLHGDEGSDERREAEARLLTDPTVRLGESGTYLTEQVSIDELPVGGA